MPIMRYRCASDHSARERRPFAKREARDRSGCAFFAHCELANCHEILALGGKIENEEEKGDCEVL
jgi:hypothetical protein